MDAVAPPSPIDFDRIADPATREAIHAVIDLDRKLAQILRTTTQPLIGEMRLRWWDERLLTLDPSDPPSEPSLTQLAHALGEEARSLAVMTEGWLPLLDGALTEVGVQAHAASRGGTMGRTIGGLLGGDEDEAANVGAAWALADLLTHLSKPEEQMLVRRVAPACLEGLSRTLSKPLAAMRPMLRASREVFGSELGPLTSISFWLARLLGRR